MKALYIDDLRPVPAQFTHCARTFGEAREMIGDHDWDIISFDHDLGSEVANETGLQLMNYLEELVYLGHLTAPDVYVHTDNGGAMKLMQLAAKKINSM